MQEFKSKIYKFLRWSEKYTKTDMVYLASGGFWLTLGQIISSASAFLLAIAFANLLPPETYGEYKYILSIASILAIPTLTGMGTAITQSVARGYEGSFIPAVKTKIKWGFLSSIASLSLSGYYFYNDNHTLTIAFLITAIFLPFFDTLGVYTNLLQGRKNFKGMSRYNMISTILSSVILVISLYITKNILLLLLIYLSSWTIIKLIFLIKDIPPHTKNNHFETQETITYGKHLSLMGIPGIISSNIDKILLWHFIGPAQLAIYSFSLSFPSRITGLLKTFSRLAFPKIAEKNLKEIKKPLIVKVLKLVVLIIPLVSLYIFIAPYLYKIFFPQYMESVFYSQILIFSLLLQPFNILSTALSAKKRTKDLYIFHTASPLVQIAFLLILTPNFGIIGAIISILLTKIIDSIILLYLLNKS